MTQTVSLDVLIIGGGIAGLWLLDELRRKGYAAILVESNALGTGQTIGSQGILHSGYKHALGGRQSAFVEALGQAVETWHACLVGIREPNLSSVSLRGACHTWRTGSWGSLLGQIGARIGLRSDLQSVQKNERPTPLAQCPGDVFRVNELIVDPMSLLTCFSLRNATRLVKGDVKEIRRTATGRVFTISLESGDGQCEHVVVCPRTVVLVAGEGNASLREKCGLPSNVMRRLPLSILVLEGALPVLNGFCLEGTKAKVVVTTQQGKGKRYWQVASECVDQTDVPFCMVDTLGHLRGALPGFEWPEFTTKMYTAQRAEAADADGSRSADARVLSEGNVITAWPTKLVLAPRLVQQVMKLLPAPSGKDLATEVFHNWTRPCVASFPWM